MQDGLQKAPVATWRCADSCTALDDELASTQLNKLRCTVQSSTACPTAGLLLRLVWLLLL
jgi:hypothetical protein